MSKFVNQIVAQQFTRPAIDRIVRNSMWLLAQNTLLVIAILSVEGWLRYALGAWATWRIASLFFIGVASRAIEEKHRRLDALPPHWLAFLRTGKGLAA